MIRVLFVLPDLKIGGVQRALISILRTAPVCNLDITVRIFTAGGELEQELPTGIKLEVSDSVSMLEGARAGISAFLKKNGMRRIFSFSKFVYHRVGARFLNHAKPNIMDKYNIAIAFSDGLATWYVAHCITADRKIAFVHTDLRAAGYNKVVEGAVYHNFESIYFVSETSRHEFSLMIPNCADKTKLLYISPDGENIRRAACAVPLTDMPDNEIKLATVGRLSHEKGIYKIPGILRRLLDDGINARWYVVGDGPERENLCHKAKIQGVEDRLVLTGMLTNPYSIVSRCEIYVQPSDYEGYCLALAEARIMCRPCVCCNFSGAREQLRDGVDGFVTGMSEDALYPMIKELALSRTLREQFTKALADAPAIYASRYVGFWATINPR